MMLENKLLAVPAPQWIVDLVVVFDWYDGPRQGFCALAEPAVEFVYDLVSEEHNPDGIDTRIVRLQELPSGTVSKFAEALNKLGLGPVRKPVWIPIWTFPTEEARSRAARLIQALTAQARTTDLLISTPDMIQITGCWKMGTPRPETVAFPESSHLPNETAKTPE